MKSWRKKKPKWLCSIIYHFKMICWVIALIRHYEFRLKHRGLLPLEEHLSIQDFINNTPKHYLDEDVALIVERDCKLTESLYDAPLSDPVSVAYNSINLYTMFSLNLFFFARLCRILKGSFLLMSKCTWCMPIDIAILIKTDPMFLMPIFVSIWRVAVLLPGLLFIPRTISWKERYDV